MSTLITIDNGGTLTDVCVIDGDQVTYTKTLTTPHDLSRCLFDGLTQVSGLLPGTDTLPGLLRSADYIRYSTTQGTNALVQRKGPRLGLLMDDAALPERLSAEPEAAGLYQALVGPRAAAVDPALDDDTLTADLVRQCNALTAAGASRLVVSFSGSDGATAERRVRGLLLAIYPRQLLGAVPLLFSHELVGGETDETRRTWSSLLNAFLHPAMERFLFHTEGRLREHRIRNPLLVFRNDGASSRVAKSSALQTYSSGPRGGVEGTRALARHYQLDDVIMMDVGGTTTDIAEIRDGQVQIARHGRVGEVTTSLPLAQITSHGIGGSSVFRVTGGQVTVGPDSVGAAPGPACFGLGGTAATITDVMLLTGVLDAATYLGGSMSLDATRSQAAVEATIADPLGIAVPEALARMLDAYAQRLAGTLQPAATANSTIAAFGGAGPMSVCAAARHAGVSKVIIPRTAAVFSAFGIGFSDIGHTYSAVLPPSADQEAAEAAGRDLTGQARRDMFAEGIDLDRCELTWSILSAAADGGGQPTALPGPGAAAAALDAGPGGRLQLEVTSVLPHPHLPDTGKAQRAELVSAGVRDLTGADGSQRKVQVAVLADQPPGAEGTGELIIEGPFFTMLLPAGWRVQLTQGGDMLLTDETAQEAGR